MLLKDKTVFIHVSGEGLEGLTVLSVIDQIQDSLNKKKFSWKTSSVFHSVNRNQTVVVIRAFPLRLYLALMELRLSTRFPVALL